MKSELTRRYLTHDCDEARVELVVQRSGNGDWYLGIVREGQKFNRLAPVANEILSPPAAIRVVTHGERKEHTYVGAAVAGLWRALGGEAPSERELLLEADVAALRARVEEFSALARLAGTTRKPVLEKLAAQKWPKHLGRPGERVLLLVAQGFRGVGRDVEAQEVEAMAQICESDKDALDLLGRYKWNQLADLPFPIRELLSIDELGNWIDDVPESVDPRSYRPKLTLELAERMNQRDMDQSLSHRWCVLIFREGGQRPSTFAAFEQEEAARRAFDLWSTQWSDSYLCRVVDGPKKYGAPGGDHVIDVSHHEWSTPPVYGPGAGTVDDD